MARSTRLWLLSSMILVATGVWLSIGVRDARRAALRSSTQGPLNQLTLALHNYHETYGCLPPAFLADEQGQPMHSWRVLILPYVDEQKLYAEYDFGEPWNGPSNSRLIDRMPRIFQARTEPESTRFANIVVVGGEGTAFPGNCSTRFEDFSDGLENTILLTEIANSDIIWSEPRDLDAGTMSFTTNVKNQPSISAVSWRRPFVTFGDSIKAWPVPENLQPQELRALTTIAGGEETGSEVIRSPRDGAAKGH